MALHIKEENWRVEIRRATDDRPLVFVSGLSELEAYKVFRTLQASLLEILFNLYLSANQRQ